MLHQIDINENKISQKISRVYPNSKFH